MRAPLLVLVLALAGAIACSGEARTTVGDDAGSSTTPEKARPADDSGGKRAPSGCLLQSTGFAVGRTAESVPRTDSANAAEWSAVDAARVKDGAGAKVTLGEGQASATLRISDFGLQLPPSAQTWGIEVVLGRHAPDGGVRDGQITIQIAGKATRYKQIETPWPVGAPGFHEYGQEIDTWGADVGPSDFTTPSFAIAVTAVRTEGAIGPVTATVDWLQVAIHYCP